MMGEGVCWPDEADEVIRGDMTAAVAYTTPAGGAVVVAVASCGIGQRDRGHGRVHHIAGVRQEAGADYP